MSQYAPSSLQPRTPAQPLRPPVCRASSSTAAARGLDCQGNWRAGTRICSSLTSITAPTAYIRGARSPDLSLLSAPGDDEERTPQGDDDELHASRSVQSRARACLLSRRRVPMPRKKRTRKSSSISTTRPSTRGLRGRLGSPGRQVHPAHIRWAADRPEGLKNFLLSESRTFPTSAPSSSGCSRTATTSSCTAMHGRSPTILPTAARP